MLSIEQARNGSFPSLTSTDPENFSNAYICESVFSTALILSSLSYLDETEELKKIKRKATYFLMAQKSQYWTFNYWDRWSNNYQTMPYPDDLDDTSCALAALFQNKPNLIDGEVMANFVVLLTVLEKQEGGPYTSWIIEKTAEKVWLDTDLAVNANIAFLLSLHEVKLDNLNRLFEENILKETYFSPYYTTPYALIYFISRSYQGAYIPKILEFIAKNPPQNILEQALKALTYLNFNQTLEKIKPLIENIAKQENWQAHTFYTGINPNQKSDEHKKDKYHSGSKSLTIALCLEALNRFNKKQQELENQSKTVLENKNFKLIHQEIIKQVEDELINYTQDNQAIKLKLQTTFWYEVIEEICNQTLENVKLAHNALNKISLLANLMPLEKILASVEFGAQKALKERYEALKFLKAYENQN